MKNLFAGALMVFLSLLSPEFNNSVNFRCDAQFVPDVNIPIIEGTLNGKKAYFLLDTGASITVLDANQAVHYEYAVIPPDMIRNNSVSGFGGTSDVTRASSVKMHFGDARVQIPFWTTDLEAIVSTIERASHYNITAIIGSDLLNKYDYVINFDSDCLWKKIKT